MLVTGTACNNILDRLAFRDRLSSKTPGDPLSFKFEALKVHLRGQTDDVVTLSFNQIEGILGFPLPASARKHGAWWTNSKSGGAQSRAWTEIGWSTERDMRGGTVTFRRNEPTTASTRRARATRRPPFDPAACSPSDFNAACSVSVNFIWLHIGRLERDAYGALAFPLAPSKPGIYRMTVTIGNRSRVYVGEAGNLGKRFGNYRKPSQSQQTSTRLHAILHEALDQGGTVLVDVAYNGISVSLGDLAIEVDLSRKPIRLLAENAALIANHGFDVDPLNL